MAHRFRFLEVFTGSNVPAFFCRLMTSKWLDVIVVRNEDTYERIEFRPLISSSAKISAAVWRY